MSMHKSTLLYIVGISFSLGSHHGARAAEDPESTPGLTVLTRGPVHEAYAQPVNLTPTPGPVVAKRPPAPVPEIPAERKPEGNVQWIPGYWAWDVDKSDFLWVSGFWRVPPPNRRWVPGHWNQVDDGWQWTPGFWVEEGRAEIRYQEPPPNSLEQGPSTPAPDEESIYVPGNWVYREDQYYWEPGNWCAAEANRVWIPSNYSWTPAGCIYNRGYWDYPLEDRGLLFAPVAFSEPLWATAGWAYQPNYAVDLAGLCGALFVQPSSCSYFFGDYYGAGYLNQGFQPWCNYGPRAWDPLFSYYGWRYRGNTGWYPGLVNLYRGRNRGELARPPLTLARQNNLALNRNLNVLNNTTNIVNNINTNTDLLRTVAPLNRINEVRGRDLRLTKVGAAEATQFRAATVQQRQVEAARTRSEKPIAAGAAGRGEARLGGQGALALPPAPNVNRSGRGEGRVTPPAAQSPRPQARPDVGVPVNPRPPNAQRPQSNPDQPRRFNPPAEARPPAPAAPRQPQQTPRFNRPDEAKPFAPSFPRSPDQPRQPFNPPNRPSTQRVPQQQPSPPRQFRPPQDFGSQQFRQRVPAAQPRPQAPVRPFASRPASPRSVPNFARSFQAAPRPQQAPPRFNPRPQNMPRPQAQPGRGQGGGRPSGGRFGGRR